MYSTLLISASASNDVPWVHNAVMTAAPTAAPTPTDITIAIATAAFVQGVPTDSTTPTPSLPRMPMLTG